MKTPKTTRTQQSSIKNFVATLTSSRAKPKTRPNGSILAYFKKAPEESMFLSEGKSSAGLEDAHGQDIYNLEVPQEPRYNEIDSPVKKRKLSPADEQLSSAPGRKPTLPSNAARPKKIPSNPFLEDSSEDEDSDNNGPRAQEKLHANVPHPVQDTPPARPTTASGCGASESTSRAESEDTRPTKGGELANTTPPGDTLQRNGSFERGALGDLADIGWEDLDEQDALDGEEYREMRYMREQERLEAQEAGETSYSDSESPALMDGSTAESCPICNGTLVGVTAGQATAHVNACLDGSLTSSSAAPKETKFKLEKMGEVEVPELGRRFARAAVPRPGQANPISVGSSSRAGEGSSGSAFARLMSGHAEDAAWASAAAAENSSRGKPAYQRTCPFYKIMPGFSICVDAFRYGAVQGCKAYFLSHFHSDHYVGLTANWTHGPIYCSRVTGSLVRSQLRTAAKYVVELEFEQRTPVPDAEGVFVTMIPANHCPGSSLFLFERTVGARTHRILHCGDFRACPSHVTHPGLRPETVDAVTGKTKKQRIDVCYLDTTYLNPRYSFPPQEDVTRACSDLCLSLDRAIATGDDSMWQRVTRRRGGAPSSGDSVGKFFHADKKQPPAGDGDSAVARQVPGPPSDNSPTAPDAFAALASKARPPSRPRLLVICGTYSIGKERICKAIAQALRTKIFAPPAKARVIAQLDDPELTALLTADPVEAQVHMQMLAEIRAETLAEYLDSYRPHFSRIVGFRPSGWNYRPVSAGANANLSPGTLATAQLLHGPGWRPRLSANDLRPQRGSTAEAACFGVPYSEHSSFRELALFLMALRVEKVVPTVNVGSENSRRRMKTWIDRWLAERRRGGLVSVLREGDDGTELWGGKDGSGGAAYW